MTTIARRCFFVCTLALGTAAAQPDAEEQIAVVAREGIGHVVAMVDASNGTHTVLAPCAEYARPAWAGKGSALAFEQRTADGAESIGILRGALTTPVTVEGIAHAHQRHPALSPDGRLLAIHAWDNYPYDTVIVVADLEGGGVQTWGGGRRMLSHPVWLPNPKLLLSIDPSRDIKIPGVDLDAVRRETGLLDGSALTATHTRALFCIGWDHHEGSLTSELLLVTETQCVPVLALVPNGPDSTRYSEWSPSVSPGGTRLLFESDYGGDREIYQIDLNGLVNLTNHRAADWNPVWEDDGRWIAYETFRDGRRAIYRLMVETLRTERVAENAWHPTWSSDGDRVACVTHVDGRTSVIIHDMENGETRNIDGIEAWAPAWRPEP